MDKPRWEPVRKALGKRRVRLQALSAQGATRDARTLLREGEPCWPSYPCAVIGAASQVALMTTRLRRVGGLVIDQPLVMLLLGGTIHFIVPFTYIYAGAPKFFWGQSFRRLATAPRDVFTLKENSFDDFADLSDHSDANSTGWVVGWDILH